MMPSPDDTTPPTTASKTDAPPPLTGRCLYVRIPLLASVPEDVTRDADQVSGLCAGMCAGLQDGLRAMLVEGASPLFDVDGVSVAYDAGES